MISGGKLTGRTFARAIGAYLREADRRRQPVSSGSQTEGGGSRASRRGRQSLRSLIRQGQGVESIDLKGPEIKSFEGIARKYNVDYAIKRDRTAQPPQYLIFFKSKDAGTLNTVLREFTASEQRRQEKARHKQARQEKRQEKREARVPLAQRVADARQRLAKAGRAPGREARRRQNQPPAR